MKLIIQIPCYNEESSLPITLADLPKQIEGIDEIEVLVIDDGSTDKTVEIAQRAGVKHIVSMPHNCGLAKAFVAGINASLLCSVCDLRYQCRFLHAAAAFRIKCEKQCKTCSLYLPYI